MKAGKACESQGGHHGWNHRVVGFNSMLNTAAAVFHTTVWQGTNGVITEGGVIAEDDDIVGFKSILIRALHEAWTRNPDDAQLQDIIRSYINVQVCDQPISAMYFMGNSTPCWPAQCAHGTRINVIRRYEVVFRRVDWPAAHQVHCMGTTRCSGRIGLKY
ncbi:hypothetical protein J3R83DRAFT_8123 [Lanmaoa asiatica]|nr:hypothetical protein J3R83DRAFT_8123 [Lanmaoa asiatica]